MFTRLNLFSSSRDFLRFFLQLGLPGVAGELGPKGYEVKVYGCFVHLAVIVILFFAIRFLKGIIYKEIDAL